MTNKKIEILQKGSPEWLKRFSADKDQTPTKNRLRLHSLRDTMAPQAQSKDHQIQPVNVNSAVTLTQEKPLTFNSLDAITTAPHSEADIPEIPIDSPPENVPEAPPQELPQDNPQELPPREPQELPSQVPEREGIPQPQDLGVFKSKR